MFSIHFNVFLYSAANAMDYYKALKQKESGHEMDKLVARSLYVILWSSYILDAYMLFLR